MIPGLVPLLMQHDGAAFAPLFVPRPSSPSYGQVGGDLSKIETGPSKVTYKGVACGHTFEGVKFDVMPDLRERKLDEYGTFIVEMIAQADKATVKATFVEKTMEVLRTVYEFADELSDTLIGLGKRPGAKASDLAGQLVLHPLSDNTTNNDVVFYKAVVSSSEEVNFGTVTGDRVFGCTFSMLLDETRNDGNLIGQIGVA